MCPMCEKHVNEAIQKAFAPESVSSSHKEKLTRIVSKEALDGEKVKAVITIEEHAPFGGLGAAVAQCLLQNDPKKAKLLALPDAPVITGVSKEVFDYYGLNAEGIVRAAKELLYE